MLRCIYIYLLIQPGRDYEAFFKASAWGASTPADNRPPERHKPDVPPDKPSVKPEKPRKPTDKLKQTHEPSNIISDSSQQKITDTSNVSKRELDM